MSNPSNNLPKLSLNAVKKAAEGKSSNLATLNSSFDRHLQRDLNFINTFARDFNQSPLLRHMNELAERQKALRLIIEDTIKPNSLIELSRQMTEIARPFSEIGKLYSNELTSLGSVAKIFGEHQKSLQAITRSIYPMALGINGSITQLSQPLNEISAFVNSMRPTAFDTITKQLQLLETSEIQAIIEGITGDIDLEDIDESELYSLSDSEITIIEEEIQDVIENPKIASELSAKAKRFLVLLFVLLIWPTIHALSVSYAYDTWINPQQNKEIDLKELAKHLKAEIDSDTLSNYRLVKVDGLRLREYPNMNSQIVSHLSKGDLLSVIDKSLRSWIMVEVTIDGESQIGWVSRRYTKHLN